MVWISNRYFKSGKMENGLIYDSNVETFKMFWILDKKIHEINWILWEFRKIESLNFEYELIN